MIKACIALSAATVMAGAAHAETMTLQCVGTSSMSGSKTATVRDSNGYSATASTGVRNNFDSAWMIEVNRDSGRIKPPARWVPPVNSGSSGGWWPLYDVKVYDTTVTGHFRLNIFNKPMFTVSRVTGMMDLSGFNGANDFQGTCAKVDVSQRAF